LELPLTHLRQLLEGDGISGRLDRAALDIASLHFPTLEPQPCLNQLNEIASRLGDRLRNFNDGREFVEKAQQYLFEDLGFHGNDQHFFDPLNSCLNQVLERRTGIPITLSVLYMEIARRLQMPVFGIGLPRHFVIQFDDGNYSTYIDPYGGRLITRAECFALAGAKLADPSLLRRVTKKQIVIRMLQNLHITYTEARKFEHAIQTLDLMILGAPEMPTWYRRRGMLLMEDHRLGDARADFERYLALEPDAEDRDEVIKQIEKIHLRLARVN
jgi:regulator of sirC expression with transglutaminase-like and TPR domain